MPEIVKYMLSIAFAVLIYGLPTVVVYWILRALASHLTRAQAIILAAQIVMLVNHLRVVLRLDLLDPVDVVQAVLVVAALCWFLIRPGRWPAIALLAFQALGTLVSFPALLNYPWGTAQHKGIVAALSLRLIVSLLLVGQLRSPVVKPAKAGWADQLD